MCAFCRSVFNIRPPSESFTSPGWICAPSHKIHFSTAAPTKHREATNVVIRPQNSPCNRSYQVCRSQSLQSRTTTRVDPSGLPVLCCLFYSSRPFCLSPERPTEVRMDEFAKAMMQNLPEMLARDLAEQEDVFLSRSMTSGGPSANLAFENQPPSLPQRNPSRVLHRLYQVAPETFLCSLRQDNVESAWRSEREAILKSTAYAASHCPSPRAPRRDHMSASKRSHLKQEMEQESRRLFFHGQDEGWGSDSSADIEAGLSSPSVRTRKQSITTAATSVDLQQCFGEKAAEGYPTPLAPYSSAASHVGPQSMRDHHTMGFSAEGYSTRGGSKEVLVDSPENHAAWPVRNAGGSWVDLGGHENLHAGLEMPRYGRGIESAKVCLEQDQTPYTKPTTFSMEDDRPGSRHQQPPLSVPERRSSLSHQVTTVILGETTDLPTNPSHNLSEEKVSQLPLPSPPPSPRQFPFHHPPQTDWDESEAALGPVVPTSRHQPRQDLQLDLSSLPPPPDELSLPPLSTTETNPHDRTFSLRSQHQQPSLLSRPRKSHSISRMPRRNVHHWLESNTRAREQPPPLPIGSPVAMSPTSSVRVSGHILEALRINVQNFPDTMLRTSSVTIDQIRDYSHKVKRSNATRQLVPKCESDEHLMVASDSPTPPTSPSVGRKSSFGNFKLMSSLRGKFSRLNNSASASSLNEQVDAHWSPTDDATLATAHCESPPLCASAARDAACVNALRCILPHGTPYLLDALYAHIIAYNYIDSLCGSFPQPQQHGQSPRLRTRPSQNAMLPSGVTSLADLMVQENVSETIVQDYQDDVASVASRTVVPSKAAALLGLSNTNMAAPVKPNPGLVGGRDNKFGKASPPGAIRGHYLESDSAMRSLREDIAHNIYRLVETVKNCSPAEGVDTEEAQDDNIVPNGNKLDDMLMRALSELVRCYEELSC